MVIKVEDTVYEGQVDVDETEQGIGRCITGKGNIYEGEWSHGRISGYGRLIWPAGLAKPFKNPRFLPCWFRATIADTQREVRYLVVE